MGLLMSDTLLIDPVLSESVRLLDDLREWPYPSDAAGDANDGDRTDLCAWMPFHAQPEPKAGRRRQRLIATEAR